MWGFRFQKVLSVITTTLKSPLTWVFILALTLRWWGIDHGMPFIYDVDEPALVRSAYSLRFDWAPHHFDWPHLHFYLTGILFWFFYNFRGFLQIIHLRPVVEKMVPILWTDPAIFYLISRLFNSLLGAATVIPVFLVGKRLRSRHLGLLAALVLAVIPYHVRSSHMATLDIPATFWVAWAAYFAVRVMYSDKFSNYLWIGVMTGLAASTKYNGVFVGLLLPVAHTVRLFARERKIRVVAGKNRVGPFLRVRPYVSAWLQGWWKLVVAGVVCTLVFFAGTPSAITEWSLFSDLDSTRSAPFQFYNVGWAGLEGMLEHLKEAFTFRAVSDLGWVFYLLLVGKIASLVVVRSAVDLFLLAFPLFYYPLAARGIRFPPHYLLPAFPFLALLIGDSLLFLKGWLKKLFPVGLAAILLSPLWLSVAVSMKFARPDTRELAATWSDENLEEGGTAVMVGEHAPVIITDGVHKRKIGNLRQVGYEENEEVVGEASYFLVGDDDLSEGEVRQNLEAAVGPLTLLREIRPTAQPILPALGLSVAQRGPSIYIYARLE